MELTTFWDYVLGSDDTDLFETGINDLPWQQKDEQCEETRVTESCLDDLGLTECVTFAEIDFTNFTRVSNNTPIKENDVTTTMLQSQPTSDSQGKS